MNAFRVIVLALILLLFPGCHIVWGGPAQPTPQVGLHASPPAAGGPPRSSAPTEPPRASKVKPLRSSGSERPSGEVSGLAFVLDAYLLNDIALEGLPPKPSILMLYRWACGQGVVYHHATPSAGDLAFFHNTYDRNQNGLWDDWLTWVALVEGVRDDGTVSLIGYLDRRIVRLYLNTARPDHAVDAHGQTLNTLLRPDPGPHGLVGSTARLFAGFADPIGPDHGATFRLNPRWQPNLLAHAPSQ